MKRETVREQVCVCVRVFACALCDPQAYEYSGVPGCTLLGTRVSRAGITARPSALVEAPARRQEHMVCTHRYTHLSLQMRPADFDSTWPPKICTMPCHCMIAAKRHPSAPQASTATASATAALVLLRPYQRTQDGTMHNDARTREGWAYVENAISTTHEKHGGARGDTGSKLVPLLHQLHLHQH